MPFFIFPTNVYTEVVIAFPVQSNIALVTKCCEEMICILLREKLDYKIIHTKTELGLESSMRPKTGCERNRIATVSIKMFYQLLPINKCSNISMDMVTIRFRSQPVFGLIELSRPSSVFVWMILESSFSHNRMQNISSWNCVTSMT